MTGSGSVRLPARPSLKQLRKQAKDLLRAWRGGDASAVERARVHKPHLVAPVLADAQFVLAREYGFDSWPQLLHHVEALRPKGIETFETLAANMMAARGDGADAAALFTIADARSLVAHKLGFESWQRLAASLTRPADNPRTVPHGLSTRPPFYRIEWRTNTLQPRQPLTDADWETIVGVIREHGIVRVDANGQMTDAALERLSQLGQVTALDLSRCRRMTDEGLRHLARMPQLEELRLHDYPGGTITDRGLEVLRHLPELRQFEMTWQRGISDTGAANLSVCDKIERVELFGSPTGDGVIKALRGKFQLRHFTTGKLVTDAGLPLLHDFPVFKTWQGGEPEFDLMSFRSSPNHLMVDGPFTDAGVAGLAGLDGVFGLGFFWHVSALTAAGLRTLSRLPNLGFLGCQGELCNDAAMEQIASLPRLRMLMAQGTVASDDGFVSLSRSQTIEHIWGRECPNLHGRGFAALARMPALKGLAVSCKNVDDASLAALPEFPALTWLTPIDVSDEGFRHVGRCARLERLTCMYCRDTGDAATEHIAGLAKLQHYHASQTRITDRSLEILGGMDSLEEVELSACAGITNAGLPNIAKLPRLRKVAVDATATVTRDGIAIFPPHVHVDFWT